MTAQKPSGAWRLGHPLGPTKERVHPLHDDFQPRRNTRRLQSHPGPFREAATWVKLSVVCPSRELAVSLRRQASSAGWSLVAVRKCLRVLRGLHLARASIFTGDSRLGEGVVALAALEHWSGARRSSQGLRRTVAGTEAGRVFLNLVMAGFMDYDLPGLNGHRLWPAKWAWFPSGPCGETFRGHPPRSSRMSCSFRD